MTNMDGARRFGVGNMVLLDSYISPDFLSSCEGVEQWISSSELVPEVGVRLGLSPKLWPLFCT